MKYPPLSIIILAAGKGTRMRSEKAKVLHKLCDQPMIHHVLKAVTPLESKQTIVVIGHQRNEVTRSLADFDIETAIQEDQLGTGHAVLCAESNINDKDGITIILCGDTPLITTQSLNNLIQHHIKNKATATVISALAEDSTGYGRIISDNQNKFQAIVEEKDASKEQKKIKEINGGIYCVNTKFLFNNLHLIDTNNKQGEVYLTDIIAIASDKDLSVERYMIESADEILGINSKEELIKAERIMNCK